MARIEILLKSVDGCSLSRALEELRSRLDYDSNKVILKEDSSCYFYFDFAKKLPGDLLLNVENKPE